MYSPTIEQSPSDFQRGMERADLVDWFKNNSSFQERHNDNDVFPCRLCDSHTCLVKWTDITSLMLYSSTETLVIKQANTIRSYHYSVVTESFQSLLLE